MAQKQGTNQERATSLNNRKTIVVYAESVEEGSWKCEDHPFSIGKRKSRCRKKVCQRYRFIQKRYRYPKCDVVLALEGCSVRYLGYSSPDAFFFQGREKDKDFDSSVSAALMRVMSEIFCLCGSLSIWKKDSPDPWYCGECELVTSVNPYWARIPFISIVMSR
ncbi:unnamed protein product [Larinioides sclopetarius]|uniref:Uncharacterized protein n=1 Tax=Larinioides sclopetarius TaxID=280406 RepID=A0AAV1ZUV9_9ARAC